MKTSTKAHFLLALALAAVIPSLRSADWNDLGEPRELGAGITPGIAVDQTGGIHVVYMHDGAILYRRANPGAPFGAVEQVPVPEGRANYNSPHLVCDAGGGLHLVFARDVTGASKKAWYSSRRNSRWSSPLLVIDHSSTDRRVNYPRIAVSPAGTSAYVGGFIGGGSTLVRLENLATAPVRTAQIETRLWVAHPLIGEKGKVLVVGRHGASGHKLESYSSRLEREGEPLLMSRGTPTKTFEATAAIIDERGIVHLAGATQTPNQVLWYNTSERATAGKPVILGPELGHDIGERVYPVMLRDARRRIYVSYREHSTGESRLTILVPDEERFADPVVVAPAITSRLRWNAHLAAAPGGGAYLVGDANGRIWFRAVGEAARGATVPR